GLAQWAEVSATYAAWTGVFDAHSYSGGSYSWGQNLYVGVGSCADAYYGWNTQEAEGFGAAGEMGHFLNSAALAAPYLSVGCGVSMLPGKPAVVCNYGLYAQIPLPDAAKIAAAMANAKNGIAEV
ncbi:hypothetical protein HDU98_001342, partial [Podochytrium sp. JEL0797]